MMKIGLAPDGTVSSGIVGSEKGVSGASLVRG